MSDGGLIRNRFKLRWEHSDSQHTSLVLFDPCGTNCGGLTVRTADLGLLFCEWRGDWDWMDCPLKFIPDFKAPPILRKREEATA